MPHGKVHLLSRSIIHSMSKTYEMRKQFWDRLYCHKLSIFSSSHCECREYKFICCVWVCYYHSFVSFTGPSRQCHLLNLNFDDLLKRTPIPMESLQHSRFNNKELSKSMMDDSTAVTPMLLSLSPRPLSAHAHIYQCTHFTVVESSVANFKSSL